MTGPGSPQEARQLRDLDIRDGLEHWPARLQLLRWSHGDPAAAWRHMLEACLSEPGNDALGLPEMLMILNGAGDALSGRVGQDFPWPEAGWSDYRARTARWHREQTHLENAALRSRPLVHFQRRGGDVVLGTLWARQVANSHQLADAGLALGNCLGAYAPQCASDETMIHTIHRTGDPAPLAALELVRTPGAWRLGQVEAPRHTPATPEQIALARRVAETAPVDPAPPAPGLEDYGVRPFPPADYMVTNDMVNDLRDELGT